MCFREAQQSAGAAVASYSQPQPRLLMYGCVCTHQNSVKETDEVVRGLWQAAQQSADSARLDATQQAAEVARLTQLRDTSWRVLARSPV